MASFPSFFLISSLLDSFTSLCCSSGHSEKQVETNLKAPPSPDSYFFTMHWPLFYCNDISVKRCNRSGKPLALPLRFTINGLRSQKNSGPAPEYCTTEAFDHNQIKDLTTNLVKFWPNLKSYKESIEQNSLPLWKEEWLRYGTCSGLSQKAYFQMALNVMNKINILSGLPTKYEPGQKYNLGTLASQITRKYAAPTIVCNTGKGDIEQIIGMKFSVNLAGNLQPIANPIISCSVLLPSATRVSTEFEIGNYLPISEI